jgi:hypothetical protein
MDKVNLPIPGEEGPPSYDNSFLHLERSSPGRFLLTIGGPPEAAEWRRRSQEQGLYYRLHGGSEFGFYT